MLRRRLELLLLAALLASGFFFLPRHWRANAASYSAPIADRAERGVPATPAAFGQRVADRRMPGPSIEPYVRPEFAAEMRALSEVMGNVETRAVMLRLADDYDKLGDRAAKRPEDDRRELPS